MRICMEPHRAFHDSLHDFFSTCLCLGNFWAFFLDSACQSTGITSHDELDCETGRLSWRVFPIPLPIWVVAYAVPRLKRVE